MHNPDQHQKDSAISSDPSSSCWNVKGSENLQSSSLLSENVVYTEEKHSSYNSYYLSCDDLNETSSFSTPKPNFKLSSAFSPNSGFRPEDKISESSSSLINPKPLVASFEYSPSGTCIKSSFPLKSLHSNSFSTPERASVSVNPFKSNNTNHTLFKGASNFESIKQHSSLNKHKSPKNIYKSPSSNFVCSKCGLGYPCTLFLCKRAKTSSSGSVKQESLVDSINSSRNKGNGNSEISNWEGKDVNPSNLVLPKHSSRIDTADIYFELNSSKRNSLESCSTLPAKKSCQASSRKSVDDLINRLFPEKKNKQSIPNGKELSKRNKLSKRKSKGTDISDFKSSKRLKDTSLTNETLLFVGESIIQSDTDSKDTCDLSNFSKTVTPIINNSTLISSNKSNYEKDEAALSQETRNLLNELVANSPSNHLDDILTSQNSQTFISEKCNETESAVLTFPNSQTLNSEKSCTSVDFAVLPLPNASFFRSEISNETESSILAFPNSQTFNSEKSAENNESAVSPLSNILVSRSELDNETKSVVSTFPSSKIFSSEKSDKHTDSKLLPLQNALDLSSENSDETESAVLALPTSQTFKSKKSVESSVSAVSLLPIELISQSEISDKTESVTLSNSKTFNPEKGGESCGSGVQNIFVFSSETSDETESSVLTLSNSPTFSSEKGDEHIESEVQNSLILSSEISDEAESAVLTLPNSPTFSSEKGDESNISDKTESEATLSNSKIFNSEKSGESCESGVQNIFVLSSETSGETESSVLALPNSPTFSSEKGDERIESEVQNALVLSSEISDETESAVLTLSHLQTLNSEKNYENSELAVSLLPNAIVSKSAVSDETESVILTFPNSQTFISEKSGEYIKSEVSPLKNTPDLNSEISDETKSAVLTFPNSQNFSSGKNDESIESAILSLPEALSLGPRSRNQTESEDLSLLNSQSLKTEKSGESIEFAENALVLSSEVEDKSTLAVLNLPNLQTSSSEKNSENNKNSVLPLSNALFVNSEIRNEIGSAILTFPDLQTFSIEKSGESIESIALPLSNALVLSSEIRDETDSAILMTSNLQTFSSDKSGESTQCAILEHPSSQNLASSVSVETIESVISTPTYSKPLSSEVNGEIASFISLASCSQTFNSESNYETKQSAAVTVSNSQTLCSEASESEILTISNSEKNYESSECTLKNSEELNSEFSEKSADSAVLTFPNSHDLTSEINNETSVSVISIPSNSQNLNFEFNREIIPVISTSSNSKTSDIESNLKTKPSALLTLPNSVALNPEESEIIECEILTLSGSGTLSSEISVESTECVPQNLQSFSSEISGENIQSTILPFSNEFDLNSETSNETEAAVFTVSNLQTLSSEISIKTTDSNISSHSNSQTLSVNSNSLSSNLNHDTNPSADIKFPISQSFSSETSEIIECEVLTLEEETFNTEISSESAEWMSKNSETLNSEIAVETVESAVSVLPNSKTLSSEVTADVVESAVLVHPNESSLNFEVTSESSESLILTPSNSQNLNSELNTETKSVWAPADSATCILESHRVAEFEEVLTVPVEAAKPLRSSESAAWIPHNSQTLNSDLIGETIESANCHLPNSQVLNSETFNETVESVVLTLPNSESLTLETSNEIVIESDVGEEKMSLSNENEDHCNFTDDKDLTNVLDIIQQSSIYDKDLSSAEICNSLNEIFSGNDSSNLSVNEVPDAEIIQTEETVVDMETSHSVAPEDVKNESEIYLQTTSDASISADTETYINLSDLYLGDNTDNFQNILIVQDEDGNIETLYLLQDSNIGEDGVVHAGGLNIETAGNTANTENILVGSSVDELQKLLISQGITNAADILITQNSENGRNELNNSTVIDSTLIDQANLEDRNHSAIDDSTLSTTDKVLISSDEMLSVAENQSIENSPLSSLAIKCIEKVDNIKDFSNIGETIIENTSDKGENLRKDSVDKIKSVTEDSPDKVENIREVSFSKVKNITEDSSDKVENILLTLSSNTESSLNFSSNEKNEHCVADNQSICESSLISDIEDNQMLGSNTSGKVELSQKAKKSISHFESNVLNAIQDSDYKNNSVLTKIPNQLRESTESSLSLPGSSKTSPLNGAVYHSELNNTHSKAVSYKSSNVMNSFISTQFKNFLSQKSKKTVPYDILKRSAKKSYCGLFSSSELHYTQSDSLINKQEFSSLNNLALKRRIEEAKSDEYSFHKRVKQGMLDCIEVNSACNDTLPKNRLVALKTFIKPFTSARKSVLDSRDGAVFNLKNKALKTCVSRSSLMKTAMKSVARKQVIGSLSSDSNLLSRHTSSGNVDMKLNCSLANNSELKTFIQPEICEIRILPNDYLKRASSLLLSQKKLELENADENMSDEEIKMSPGCDSPLRDLLSFKCTCTCTAKEVPCICNNSILQLTCEGEDSMDNNIVHCENSVSQQYLLTPSSEVKHRAFCDVHIARLRQHHCCPKCGIFCSQGEFLRCAADESENKENHLFHTGCFIIPAAGLPPSCPHCCKFSCFNVVSLIYKSSADSKPNEVPSDSQNITCNLSGCDIYMSVHQTPKTVTVSESKIFVPDTNEIQQMITSLAKEKTLRLRPTGKCLYNPIKTGDVQKVMQLIGNGVNPNHKFRMHSNNTPLHVAAYYGWIGILHILIQAGASIDAVNDDLETPLIVAVERKQLPIIRYLIHAGAQIDVKDCNGMTCFHIACKNGFKEIAEFLYSTGRINVNLQDDGGWTSLVWACEHKHLGLVRWLLEIGSDPNVRDNEENTVLHWAAYSGESEIAQLFLDKGCTLSYVNKHGDSALHIAARENNFECVRLFATNGAVLDQKNKSNQTPLMCCEDDSLSYNYLCECISSGALKLKKMQLEKHVVFRDISRGAELYPIQAINEVDNEEFIMEFKYIVRNCHRSGVEIICTVNNMQFCCCSDNCITRECCCTMNSRCWYDDNGCLSADFNIFWPPTIYECNKTCHCPKTCINRVVQQGLRYPLQLYRTRFQGWGVRTLQDVPKGAFVCEYVGELITGSEATERDDDTYYFDLESQDADYCLDGRYYGNVARFLNHSCEPNLIAVKVFVDHQDLNFPRIAFFTVRHIKAFEELCFDYGLDFWIVKCQSILCTCNTPSCKYSKDTIDETLQKFFMDTKAENDTSTDSVLTTI